MIKINKPWIEKNQDKSRCYCDLYIDNEKKSIWFEVDSKYEKYLVDDRVDAYLIGILNWAMRNNHDIICEYPVTEDLLYNIKTVLIPSLTKYSKNLSMITIDAQTIEPLSQGDGVGTGCSCGIDSFSAIYNHINTEYKNFNLTHICINNVGAFNQCYSEYGIEKTKNERYEITDIVAKDLGIELIKTDSNFCEVIEQKHLLTHTYSSCFAIYMLQKLWKKYYYASSGYDYSKFSIINNDLNSCDHYELLSLQCFSTPSLTIYSEGGEKTRLEKTKDIVDFDVAQKNLHVCIAKSTNCGLCPKCKRTLVSLDYLDKLDDFNEVFDIEYYKKNKKKYYRWLYEQHKNKDDMNEPVYQGLKNKIEFKKSIRYYKYIVNFKVILKKIIPKSIIKKIKNKM